MDQNQERSARTRGEQGEIIGGLLLGKLSSWTEEGEGTKKLRKKEIKEGMKRRRRQNLHCCKVEGSRT